MLHGPRDLIAKLNGHPDWKQLDAQGRSDARETVSALAELFQRADQAARNSITDGIRESAKYVMSDYTVEEASEARRTGRNKRSSMG